MYHRSCHGVLNDGKLECVVVNLNYRRPMPIWKTVQALSWGFVVGLVQSFVALPC